MKIARYIGDLLYDYECVVLPGLGGFITSETPATINEVTHYFKPPFKKVFFNAHLRANDGLLVNYVAKEQGLTYKEAKSEVDNFVFLCHDALKKGKRINFHKIGYLYLDSKENIVFEQDTTVNYDAEAFGLTSFVSPAVRRISQEEKLKEKVYRRNIYNKDDKPSKKPVDRKQAQPEKQETTTTKQHSTLRMQADVKRSPLKTQLAFLLIILLGIAVGVGIMHKETVKVYFNRYSSTVPVFYRWANDYFVDNLDKINFPAFANSPVGNMLAQAAKNNAVKPAETTENKQQNIVEETENDIEQPIIANTDTITQQENITNKNNENISSVQEAGLLGDILSNDDKMPVDEVTTVEENIPEENVEPAEPVKTNITEKPASEISHSHTANSHIFIIAGSFKSIYNARKLVKMLNAKGYNALIADTNSYGMYRVAYGSFSDISEAKRQLVAIRNEENPSAWIMHK